ncbi:MAG: polysaccharide deacetylase family protein, partial [Desulfobacterales bacterium]|nr:polysaccharide deacetylase family protein [Desulfobacterales bacterium]
CDRQSSKWCWHQHGWTHTNHEPVGKKCEFGNSRAPADIEDDIISGKERLQNIIGAQVSPIFTPPWNRCSQSTLHILKNAGFKAVSRSSGATPESAPLFADYQVNVDLHTRKESDHASCLSALVSEFKQATRSGRVGIMIHHQRMNRNAFTVLENLLALVAENELLQAVDFNRLLN